MNPAHPVRSWGMRIAAFASATLPLPAAASTIIERLQDVGEFSGFKPDRGTGTEDLAWIVGGIIEASLALVGVVFVAQLVFAGYLWMTAHGESDPIDKAKHIIRRSIVGLVIVLSAWAITDFIVSKLVGATGV